MSKSRASDTELSGSRDEQSGSSGPSVPRTNPALPTGRLRQVTMTTQGALEIEDEAHSSTEPPPRGSDPYIGATIDERYFVEAQLGEGGMGVVYRCRHTIIDKKVAMKVLRADMARNEEVTERFLNEARSASSVGNPHIIDISDFGRLPDGATYFIMEFLVGKPLADLTEEGIALPPERAGHICMQLAEGLAAAHAAGIVHRDLKPDNIFLVTRGIESDFVKILDFGIAKASTSSNKLTQAGQVFGTPHYMSPEQAAGSEVDLRSDIYAVGVILYELVTGRLPFDADNFMAILTQHMYKEPQHPSDMEGLLYPLPEGLEAIILKCLAKEPGQRYQTMRELDEDLCRVFAHILPPSITSRRPVPTDTYGSPREVYESRPGAPKKSNLALYASVGIVGALIASGLVWMGRSSAETAPAPEAVAVVAPEPVAAPTPPVAVTKQVAIAVSPLEAKVFSGDKDLGESPVVVEVGDEPLALSIRLAGYESKELTIDGSEKKVSVALEKVAKAQGAPRPRPIVGPAPKPTPKPKSGGSELEDPWE